MFIMIVIKILRREKQTAVPETPGGWEEGVVAAEVRAQQPAVEWNALTGKQAARKRNGSGKSGSARSAQEGDGEDGLFVCSFL